MLLPHEQSIYKRGDSKRKSYSLFLNGKLWGSSPQHTRANILSSTQLYNQKPKEARQKEGGKRGKKKEEGGNRVQKEAKLNKLS
jgi:hypothetical protein